ncbi:MAG: hypothetical protein PVF21_06390, partial [Thiohalophilus sp.]
MSSFPNFDLTMHNAAKFSAKPILLAGFSLILLLTIGLTGISIYFLASYGSNMTQGLNTQDLKEEYGRIMRSAVRQRSI